MRATWDGFHENHMEFRFEVDDLVEYTRMPGAIFRIVERFRDYDAYPFVRVKFFGPHKGLSPVTKGRLHKHFRIKTFCSNQERLVPANPMLALAVSSLG